MFTIEDKETKTIKWISGKYKVPVDITRLGGECYLTFGYDNKIKDTIKNCFTGTRWHGYEDPPIKKWSVKHCPHNLFQFEFFSGGDPYKWWDKEYPLIVPRELPKGIVPFAHQIDLASFVHAVRYVLLAAEMGTGKTLAAILAAELSAPKKLLWVGPKAALEAAKLEFWKWQTWLKPEFVTYNGLKGYAERVHTEGVPDFVVFDESSKLKTHATQRTQAAMYVADCVRSEYGDLGAVVLMSGSPAPKSPVDWYSQCETACPGFLAEGHPSKFEQRMAIVIQKQSADGGVYPHRVSWLDDERKCGVCGRFKDDPLHLPIYPESHAFAKSINEVVKLHSRMKGLVKVKFKKDCLNLPEKVYRPIRLEPTREMKRLANLISKTSPTAIQALTRLRELSDGFQYKEVESGTETCEVCQGKRVYRQPVYNGPEKTEQFLVSLGLVIISTPEDTPIDPSQFPDLFTLADIACPNCKGVGKTKTYRREIAEVATPKEEALKELLDEFDDVGRVVIFGGFTGSIEKILSILNRQGWQWMKVDGQGWNSSAELVDKGKGAELLKEFQDGETPRMAFVGQPGAGGIGLTLTASPVIIYYSNDFNAESRIQSEDRIHRPGMDINRGATIIDLLHLETDQYILDNLQKKRDLQSLTLGELGKILENTNEQRAY